MVNLTIDLKRSVYKTWKGKFSQSFDTEDSDLHSLILTLTADIVDRHKLVLLDIVI